MTLINNIPEYFHSFRELILTTRLNQTIGKSIIKEDITLGIITLVSTKIKDKTVISGITNK